MRGATRVERVRGEAGDRRACTIHACACACGEGDRRRAREEQGAGRGGERGRAGRRAPPALEAVSGLSGDGVKRPPFRPTASGPSREGGRPIKERCRSAEVGGVRRGESRASGTSAVCGREGTRERRPGVVSRRGAASGCCGSGSEKDTPAGRLEPPAPSGSGASSAMGAGSGADTAGAALAVAKSTDILPMSPEAGAADRKSASTSPPGVITSASALARLPRGDEAAGATKDTASTAFRTFALLAPPPITRRDAGGGHQRRDGGGVLHCAPAGHSAPCSRRVLGAGQLQEVAPMPPPPRPPT